MANEIIGRNLEVGFATEATRGTKESAADKWFKNVSANIVERAEHAEDDTSRGVLENQEGRRVVQKYVEGDLEGIAHADAIGYLYASIYGIASTSNVSGSVYSHTFTMQQDIEHQSLSVFAKDGDVQQIVAAGCMVNTLEVNASTDNYVRFTANITGKTSEDDTDSPSYDTEYDFIGKDITVKVADTEGDLATADPVKVKEMSIAHDQGGIRDHVFGSYDPDNVYNAMHDIEGSFTLNFTDETFKDLYLGDDAKYMSITIEGDADLGDGNNPSITYTFYKVQFNDWNRSGGNDELVTQEITFKAFYNESDSAQSQVVLQNLTSSYENVPQS